MRYFHRKTLTMVALMNLPGETEEIYNSVMDILEKNKLKDKVIGFVQLTPVQILAGRNAKVNETSKEFRKTNSWSGTLFKQQ